ncbi:MarR family transcriptional regulator [Streptomyces pseudovenezuelae]|uniref:MarR family transcriptional regulator n=1 Tax=Streptomyces pseudovenezuelae TaxID=67350 RepID=UPI002E375377|nr:MarR family transcriptional regulator [Streptomyces pseudovenezuelae]
MPAWHRQKVKVPKRVWGGSFSAGAVAYHAQITALAQRPDGCRASVKVLAGYLGDSKRTAERCLAELAEPGPDGIAELVTVRRTGSDGDGETAVRRTRGAARTEHFAYVPVLAVKVLRHPLFVVYCALAYAVATRTPVTAAELASLVGVTERTARRMTDELEGAGWITVYRRTGDHGRHTYDVHDQPLRPVPDEPGPPDTDGGSGPGGDGGSLAIKEDAGWTDKRTTDVGGSFRRRRGDRKWVRPAVDTAGNSGEVPPALRGRMRPAAPPPYAGPQLTLSPRVWAVLEPVADLLPDVGDFAVRRIAREIGRQLDDGIWADDIRDQITRLRAWTPTEDIRDPGRWLLGAVLPVRSRCGMTGCHFGFLAHTGAPCKVCAELQAARARGDHPPHTGAWHECTQCQRPARQPFPGGICRSCA